ncbi:MAG: hypothetical protein P1V34_09045 [Alphaproteobacteria bacterium]|nr:hypothetical protein [Alphaproteobacteria bacterium]
MADTADTPQYTKRRRKSRRKVWAIVAIVLGLFAMLWVGPRMVDWTPYKADIAALITKQLGVTVVLRGGLQIEILPQPRITAADIAVTGEPATGTIRWLRGSLNLRALLFGRIIPENLELVEANLKFPLRLAATGRYDGATTVVIEEGRLRFLDGPDWLPDQLEAINGRLTLGANPKTAPQRLYAFDGDARVLGEPLGVSVEGRMNGGVTLSIGHGPSASDLAIQGRPTEEGGWTGKATLVLEEAGFLSTLKADAVTRLLGEGPATLDARIESSPEDILTITMESLQSRQLTGTGVVTLVSGPRPALDMKLDLSQVDLTGLDPTQTGASSGRLATDFLQGLRIFSGLDITAMVSARSIAFRDQTLRKGTLSFAAGGGIAVIDRASIALPGAADLSLLGTFQAINDAWQFDGEAGLVARNVRPLLGWQVPDLISMLDSLPPDRISSVDATAKMLITPNVTELTEIKGRLDDTIWAGAVSVSDSGVTPSLQVVLQGDSLNLDRYWPAGSDKLNAPTDILTQIIPFFGRAPQTITLYLDRVILNSVPASGITLDLRSKQQDVDGVQGALAIGNLAGAQVMAELSLNAAQTGQAQVTAQIPALDRILGAFGLGARRAASFASFGPTAVTLDLSLAPDRGIGYAFEALGEGGDARVNGVFTPGLKNRITVSDGSFNGSLGGYDLTLFDLTAGCDGDGLDGFACTNVTAAMPGLRLGGDVTATRATDDVDVAITLQNSTADLGLFTARAGLPLVPDGSVALAGSLVGIGTGLDDAVANLSGTIDVTGMASLVLRSRGGGQIGNVGRLRGYIRDAFGRPGAVTGTVVLAPDGLGTKMRLQGAGDVLAQGQARLSPELETLTASIKVQRGNASEDLLSLTATGAVGSPSVRLKGSWLRAQ